MARWLVVSAIWAVLLSVSGKFDAFNAVAVGLFIGGLSTLALKLFGMDKEK